MSLGHWGGFVKVAGCWFRGLSEAQELRGLRKIGVLNPLKSDILLHGLPFLLRII